MTMGTYPEGLDCVWIGTDRDGHVGAFVTGGAGPIPLAELIDSPLPVEDIEAAVCELPPVSGSHLFVQMTRPDDFVEMARRGFFVYDWRDVHRAAHELSRVYEQIAAPLDPITISKLPEPLKSMAAKAAFPRSAFIQELTLDVTGILECISVE